ncbi:predicted permease [Longilinea arvoryzae]|uniref:Predicted permease n=1 Tax=Longilinea arvoryzae TaxID=360412 RepID=A0A0S7BFJ1_9CHLR|nr:permease [Longilinea arvoryzae]GAP13347.1 predicted permease [Longilinea arvoryzae]
MTHILPVLLELLRAGWLSLLDYMAAHVLLCLVPAFVIAGFLSALLPKEAVTRYLGPRASKWISYPAAAFGGFILAVCSCTILPLFAGIWKRGAGLGPAVTFLFVGPAINILAITYTGAAIGFDVALARLILSIGFGILIGLIMAWVYRREEARRAQEMEDSGVFDQTARVRPVVWGLLALLALVLVAGTLQVDLLTKPFADLNLPFAADSGLVSSLASAGLSLQGAALILMMILIGLLAWKGFEKIYDRFDGWTLAALIAIGLTILIAAPVEKAGSLALGLNGRFMAEILLLAAIGWLGATRLDRDDLTGWIWETWKFVKQIFPLLIVGVFLAGAAKNIIPSQWVQSLAGRNTLLANFAGVIFGVFMYFPTLVEVPVAKMFLDLGMARGPLLAYLLADPELSLQSILVLNKIMGRKKTGLYVGLVAVLATVAGWIFGAFVAA